MYFDWWSINSLASFFDVLSCFLMDGSKVYWLHSLMFFKEFLGTVQGSIDLLASFLDVLSSIHALQIMTIEENNIFLIAQRDNIRDCVISVDRFKRRLNSKKMKQNHTIQKRIQNANKRNVNWRKLWNLIFLAMTKMATMHWIHWILWIVDIRYILVLLNVFESRISFDERGQCLKIERGKSD